MKEDRELVPKRRFKEFENCGDWEEFTLGEVSDSFEYGLNASATSFDGKNKYIRITDIDNDTRLFDKTELTSPKIDLTSADNYLMKKGDVLFARTGASVGKTYRYQESDGKVYYAGFLIRARISQEFDSEFIFQNTLTSKYDEFIRIESQRSGQPGVNAQEYGNFNLMIPNKEEQIKIGDFFIQLDNLITLHQHKLKKIKALKVAYLSDMFPREGEKYPKIRFKGFTDAWEQNQWVDKIDISTNMVDPKTGNYNDLPHIGPGNIESFTGRLLNNVNTVKEDNLISGKFYFNKGDVIYGKINPQLGKYIYAPYEGLASADSYILNVKNGLDQKFLFILLQTEDFFTYSVSVSMRSGMPKINRGELNAYTFMSPSYNEQAKIGSFFLSIDNLITLHQQKLDKLKNIKKAYLNEMFV